MVIEVGLVSMMNFPSRHRNVCLTCKCFFCWGGGYFIGDTIQIGRGEDRKLIIQLLTLSSEAEGKRMDAT